MLQFSQQRRSGQVLRHLHPGSKSMHCSSTPTLPLITTASPTLLCRWEAMEKRSTYTGIKSKPLPSPSCPPPHVPPTTASPHPPQVV